MSGGTESSCRFEISKLDETAQQVAHALCAEVIKQDQVGRGGPAPENIIKVFDEVCAELAMALLQLLQWSPSEEHMFRAVGALARLVHHSPDVPQLVAMVGPDPSAFRGASPRVDEQIDIIMKKVQM